MDRRTLLYGGVALGLGVAIPGAAFADDGDLTSTTGLNHDELILVDQTAEGFKEIVETGGFRLDDGSFQPFDFDKFYAAIDEGQSDQDVLNAAAGATGLAAVGTRKWNTQHFGKRLAKKLGIADAKAIIKAFAEPKVRKLLASHKWRKAAAAALKILKKVSPKIAKLVAKKGAKMLLPGGAAGALAWAAAQCALGEL